VAIIGSIAICSSEKFLIDGNKEVSVSDRSGDPIDNSFSGHHNDICSGIINNSGSSSSSHSNSGGGIFKFCCAIQDITDEVTKQLWLSTPKHQLSLWIPKRISYNDKIYDTTGRNVMLEILSKDKAMSITSISDPSSVRFTGLLNDWLKSIVDNNIFEATRLSLFDHITLIHSLLNHLNTIHTQSEKKNVCENMIPLLLKYDGVIELDEVILCHLLTILKQVLITYYHHSYGAVSIVISETIRFNHLISSLLTFADHLEASSCGITHIHLQRCINDFIHDQHNSCQHDYTQPSSTSSSSYQLSSLPSIKLPLKSLNLSHNHFLSYVDCPWSNAR